MENLGDSIIIGKGTGLSTFLSNNLGIKSIKSKDLIGLDLSSYKTIIYTSIDPSSYFKQKEIYPYLDSSYLEKNFRTLYYVLESKFKGKMIYISSVDSGSYDVFRKDSTDQLEEMFTPYSFSKFTAESLFLNHDSFDRCVVLRLGMLWPTKYESNFRRNISENDRIILQKHN